MEPILPARSAIQPFVQNSSFIDMTFLVILPLYDKNFQHTDQTYEKNSHSLYNMMAPVIVLNTVHHHTNRSRGYKIFHALQLNSAEHKI